MAIEKYSEAQKTAMVKRIEELRNAGESLDSACQMVGKEYNKTASSVRSLYNWWKRRLAGKDYNADRRKKRSENPTAGLEKLLKPIEMAIGGSNTESNSSPQTSRGGLKERMLNLLEKIAEMDE